jgi:hypothetical protein
MTFMALTHVAWFGDPGERELATSAAHEAGHAFACPVLGLRVYRVEIREQGDLGGLCTHERGEDAEQLVVAVAGEIADVQLGVHDPTVAGECARSDRRVALDLARRLDPTNPDRAIRRASAQVREFLGGRNWWALERFARILLKQRVLEGEELNSLLRAALSGARDLWAAVETEDREIAIGRRLAFERLIRQGLDQGTAWAEADRLARAAWAEADREAIVDPGERLQLLVAAMRGPG